LDTARYSKTVEEFPVPGGIDRLTLVIRKKGKGKGAVAYLGASAKYYCVSTPYETIGGDT
jgi:hypothetical protein